MTAMSFLQMIFGAFQFHFIYLTQNRCTLLAHLYFTSRLWQRKAEYTIDKLQENLPTVKCQHISVISGLVIFFFFQKLLSLAIAFQNLAYKKQKQIMQMECQF